MSVTEGKPHWREEVEFFDRLAEDQLDSLRPFGKRTLERYRHQRRVWLPAEQRFLAVGNVERKRVLDVGCGDGLNSVMLALLGARVTGVDISPRSIALAQRRAALNGVGDRISFICAPLERTDFSPESFEVIWCDAFLHHVRDELPAMLARLNDWCVPGGVIMIAEPVNLSDTLRRLRLAVFPPPVGTAHESPLDRRDLNETLAAFSHARVRYYGFLGRLDKFVLAKGNFEYSSWARRFIAVALRLLDVPVLSLPLLHRLASQVVIIASPPRNAGFGS